MSFWLGGVADNPSEFATALRLNTHKRHKCNNDPANTNELYVWAQWPPKYASSAIYYKGRVAPKFRISATQPRGFRRLGAFLDAKLPTNVPIISVHIQVLGITQNSKEILYGTHTTNISK